MRIIFWIALRLRLRSKFWGDLFQWEMSRKVKKAISMIDIDTSDIKIVPKQDLSNKLGL